MKTQHSPQKDKPKKLCTQSRENTPKVGSTLILPATCIPLPEDTDLLSGPCSSWQDFFEITLPPALGERQHFQALCHHHHAVRCPGYITLLVRTECWASRQLWCDQQDGRSNTAQPQCCLKYPKVMGTLYLLTPSGSGSLETEWEQISMGGRVWNRKWYFTLFLSQLEKQKQTGPGNITNKWDKYSHRVKEAARLWEPGQSITHAASEGPWLSTMSWV